jgi:hypothetical protein
MFLKQDGDFWLGFTKFGMIYGMTLVNKGCSLSVAFLFALLQVSCNLFKNCSKFRNPYPNNSRLVIVLLICLALNLH